MTSIDDTKTAMWMLHPDAIHSCWSQGARGSAPFIFGQINWPCLNRGIDYAHHITMCPPPYFKTFLRPCKCIQGQWCPRTFCIHDLPALCSHMYIFLVPTGWFLKTITFQHPKWAIFHPQFKVNDHTEIYLGVVLQWKVSINL